MITFDELMATPIGKMRDEIKALSAERDKLREALNVAKEALSYVAYEFGYPTAPGEYAKATVLSSSALARIEEIEKK